MSLEVEIEERMYVSQERSYHLQPGHRIRVSPGVNGIAQVRRFSSGVLMETFVISDEQTYGEYFKDMRFSIKCIAETVLVKMGQDNREVASGGGSGDLLAANNLSDLDNASIARTNLGLGTLATQNGTFSGTHSGSSSGTNTGDQDLSGLMAKSANLSDVSNAASARNNLGLGTLATQNGTFSGTSSGTNTGDQDLSGLLVKSNNLSDLSSAATARGNLGLGALAVEDGVNFTATGGVERALDSKLSDFVSVGDFGAVGDGVADDTAAFAAAALAAPGYSNMVDIGSDVPAPVNVDVYVPAGTYKLASKVKTQRRVTWHFGDGAIVDDSAMLDGVLVRGSRVNATHIGIGGNATNISARANHHTGKLDKSPAVYGIAEQASLSVNGPLHSVAVFSDNTGTTCETLTGTTFTSTSVTFTSALDFDDFKPGTVLTVGTQAGAIMGFADSWNAATKTIYVQGWYKFTGVSGDKETPSNGSTVRLNYWRKIWAHNANVTLPSGADTIQATGFELGTVNNQSDVSETYSSTGRYLWGYDCVNLGTYTSSTAFIARNKFVEGFLSKGAKYSFRVLPASDPTKDITVYGFSYEQESGVAFRSMAGGQPSWRVGYDGNMEIGRQDIAQTTFIDLHSSGAGSDYDARIQVTGGGAASGNGTLTYTAAQHSFVGGMKFGTFTADGSATIAGYITITDAGGTTRKLLVAA